MITVDLFKENTPPYERVLTLRSNMPRSEPATPSENTRQAVEKTQAATQLRTQKAILIHEIWPNVEPRKYAQFQG